MADLSDCNSYRMLKYEWRSRQGLLFSFFPAIQPCIMTPDSGAG